MAKKKTNKMADMAVINSGNMEKIEAAIREYAFDQETQIFLIKHSELRPILNLYMSIRKLGKQALTHLLSAPAGKYTPELIRSAVVGNSLNEHNEELLIEFYPELLEDYLTANPNGSYFSSGEVEELAKEAGYEDIIKRHPRPVFNKPALQSLGGMFTLEMLAKLGV